MQTFAETQPAKDLDDTELLKDIAELKESVLNLNRDLFILEEDLLFPANTQISVFVSIDKGHFFELENLEIKINKKTIASHLYTEKQLNALQRGGVQRLYLGNLKNGKHHILALLTGKGRDQRDVKRAAGLTFVKDSEAVLLEIKIKDNQARQQADFIIINNSNKK